MNKQRFNEIFAESLKLITEVVQIKSKEYSGKSDTLDTTDVFVNFKRAALLNKKETPEQALIGMLKKHLVYVLMMVEELPQETPSKPLVDEKIGDSIIYLFLLKALLYERIENENNI